jgi:thiamine kinase-like enzyme
MRKYTIVPITIIGLESECKIIQKKFAKYNHEINKYNFLSQYCGSVLPEIYYIDLEKRIVLMDDLNEKYFPGFHFNDDNEYGIIFRKNYKAIINALAKFHGTFWENHKTFKQVGLDRRLESKENLIDHINGMEKDFKKYRNAEKADRIPKKWENFENKIEIEKLEYFQTAINMLKQEYVKLIDTRFKRGKNITIIHGDFHPGNTYMSMSKSRDIKFIDFEAVRIGLCTEDLAMFLALHVEPKLKTAKPLLEHYYKCLCEYAKDYSYDNFIDDYKISVMENMFFTIRLINRGIFDFYMRDRAIMAFETLILRNG